MYKFFCLLIIILIFLLPIPRMSAEDLDCTSSDCHDDLLEGEMIHSPVDEGECDVCHTQNKAEHPGPAGKEFALEPDDLLELCGDCHEISEESDHPPIPDGMCTSCHDPHHSSQSYLFVGETPGESCGECHEIDFADMKHIHGPVVVKACDSCHEGHGSLDNTLLPEGDETELCYKCHTEKETEFEAYETLHDPVTGSCGDCHEAHASDHPFQLLEETTTLCYECHEDISDLAGEHGSEHDALTKGEQCMSCHNAHGSDHASNLSKDSYDLCLACHDKSIKSDGMVLTDMKNLLEKNPNWHGPIKDKDCAGCHDPHGSENVSLLISHYPKEFYKPFDAENYKLCFQCHEEQNVMQERSTLTNFRDGDWNLHFLHVTREKGRTCRACHQVHASELPFHIREAVPFGCWELPVNYSADKNGGACTPGCHKTATYQR